MLGTWYQGEKTAELGDKHTEVSQQVFGFHYGLIRKSNTGTRADKINIKF